MGRKQKQPVKVPPGQLADAILDLLPGKVAEFAPKLGRKRTDNTIRARLTHLESAGAIACEAGVWVRLETDPEIPGLPGYVFPEDLDGESRELLAHKVAELVDASTDLDSFVVELLENYVRCLQRARIAVMDVHQAGMFTRASSGRRYAHPGIAIAREAERDSHVYREAIDKRKGKDTGDADPDDDLSGV